MTDIVYRLRNEVPCTSDIGCADELCNEAAAEIERLRAALEVTSNDCKEAFADNERLRAALEGAAVQFANNNLPAFSHQCRAALKKKT